MCTVSPAVSDYGVRHAGRERRGNQRKRDCVCVSERPDIATLSQSNLFAPVQIVQIAPSTRHHSRTRTRRILPRARRTHLPSSLAVDLIHEVPLIWPKRSLRGLPPLSSLRPRIPSLSSSLSSVTRQSKSEGWYCTAGNT